MKSASTDLVVFQERVEFTFAFSEPEDHKELPDIQLFVIIFL